MKNSRAYLLLLMSLIVAALLIHQRYEQLKTDHLRMRQSSQEIAYRSVTNTLRLVSRSLADEVLQKEELLKLIYDIVYSEGPRQNELRGQLYRNLYQMYARISQHSIRQFHFHFPDGRSMLRFHSPDKADDNLRPYRPSVVIANRQHKEVHGYESGRIVHGFRHVYPLNYHGVAIGSVEISNSFQQIGAELSEITKPTGTELLFLMYKPDLWYKLAEGQQHLYSPSVLHPDYVVENQYAAAYQNFGGTLQTSESLLQIQQEIRRDSSLKEKMEAEKNFSLVTRYNDQLYSVIFHSVQNVSGKHAAYFIAITPEPYIRSLMVNSFIQFGVVTVLFILILHYHRGLTQFRQQQKSTADFLQILSDNMGQGMYATDKDGAISYINHEATQLLGRSKEEVMGENAHELFHFDDLDHQQQGCFILNAILQGVTCRQELAYFKNKQAEKFPVELTCTPIYNNKEIVGTITLFHDITQRIEDQQELLDAKAQLENANHHLSELARVDALTGVANRREFDQTLSNLLKSAYRKNERLAILMIDIDHFKRYNDHYGHQKGDDCLRKVVKIIRDACMRPDDFIARYGGEEFVVLLPQTRQEDAIHVAERIQERMRLAQIPHGNSPVKSIVTLSIGVCSMVPHDLSSEQQFIDCADRRLYVAKNSGRDQICTQD